MHHFVVLALESRGKRLACYTKTSDADRFTRVSGIERQFQISAPGTAPMHFPVCPAPHSPTTSRLPQACCLSEGRADSLVYSSAASSSVFIAVTSLSIPPHPPPFNPLQNTHASSLGPHCEVLPVSLVANLINAFIR